MEVNIREINGISILDIQGSIIGSDCTDLYYDIQNRIASAEEGKVKVLLNLTKVPMMDSSGLGIIVGAYTAVQRKKGRMALLNLGEKVRQLIVMAKLRTIFEIYDNEDEALASFQ